MVLNQNRGRFNFTTITVKKAVWLIALTCTITFVIYMFADDALEPELKDILSEFNTQHSAENNGTIYTLGMWASFDDDPYDVGLQILHNTLVNDGYLSEEIYQSSYPNDKWLADIAVDESTSPLLCDFRSPSCLDFIWDNSAQIPSLLNKYDQYIELYDGLISYESFLPVIKPSFNEPLKVSELDLLSVHLKLLKSIAFFKGGLIEEASKELSGLIDFNRSQIKSSYKMIPKVISTVHYGLCIQVSSYLLAKTNTSNVNSWQSVYDAFQSMGIEYVSMKKQYLREVAAFSNEISTITSSQFENYQIEKYGEPLARLLYKPNKTLNLFYKYMSNGYDTVHYEQGLLKERDIKLTGKDILGFQLNNYIGSMHVSISAPRYLNIEVDLHELNIKQNLFRKIYKLRLVGKSSEEIGLNLLKSPYTGNEAFLVGNQLCLEGKEGSKQDMCVYVQSL
ncbi:hypothetical protein [Paraglaciecola chathamensis]|uniref:Uncharacterized protein n=1 Tax=Paraglaciecola agarilytica NO2 TaxID=1125747 RepID=A0ABQ0I404_9ALTE|nr:hypothetical protein [Paraglaciecola agarilytica]GAC04075.1 hypothetical protein GAGA_1217 [Paraglaciecola agarilytica NO2]